jgi:hypothetical protein
MLYESKNINIFQKQVGCNIINLSALSSPLRPLNKDKCKKKRINVKKKKLSFIILQRESASIRVDLFVSMIICVTVA